MCGSIKLVNWGAPRNQAAAAEACCGANQLLNTRGVLPPWMGMTWDCCVGWTELWQSHDFLLCSLWVFLWLPRFCCVGLKKPTGSGGSALWAGAGPAMATSPLPTL